MSGALGARAHPMHPQPAVLTVAIEHTGPIEVKALSESLSALGTTSARFAEREGLPLPGEDVRLYVRDIRSGSILIDLIALASQAATVAEHTAAVINSITGFTKHVADIIDFFRGKRPDEPEQLDRRDVSAVSELLKPVADQAASQMAFTAHEGGVMNVTLNVLGNDPAAVVHRAEHWHGMQALPASGIHRGVLFYWHQAQDKMGGRAATAVRSSPFHHARSRRAS